MNGTFLIIGERYEEFDSKKGRQRVRRLALLDQDRPTFLGGLDYEPKGDDATALPAGAVEGKTIRLGITNMSLAYGGRFMVTAHLLIGDQPAAAGKSPSGK